MFFISREKYRKLLEAAAVADEQPAQQSSASTENDAGSTDASVDTTGQDNASQNQDNTSDDNSNDNNENQSDDGSQDLSSDNLSGFDDGGGGDDSSDDNGDDSSSGEDDNSNEGEEVDENKKTEEEIFSSLTNDQLDIKHKELKNQYLKLYDITTEIVDKISYIPISEDITFIIDYVSTTLSNLRDMIVDYINDAYKTKSYTENLINYNRFLATLSGINKILEEINTTKEK